MAKLYGILANGGEDKGKTLMSLETIRTLFSPIISGHTLDLGEYEVLGRGLAEYHNTEVSNQRRLKHNLGSITAMPRNIKCIGFFYHNFL